MSSHCCFANVLSAYAGYWSRESGLLYVRQTNHKRCATNAEHDCFCRENIKNQLQYNLIIAL